MTAPATAHTPPAVIAPSSSTVAKEDRSASGHDDDAVNVVSLELLGNGLTYSLSYERLFPLWHVGLRVGASYLAYPVSTTQGAGDLKLATFPVVASWYWGTPSHKLQVGGGVTVIWASASTDAQGLSYGDSGAGVAATAVLGYRYLPQKGGFTFGAGLTPLLRSGKGLLMWGGADAGWAF